MKDKNLKLTCIAIKTKFEKTIFILIMICLAIIAINGFITKFEIKKIEKKYLDFDSLNITDRENGICADMYKEGFDWGVAQYEIDFSTFFIGLEDMPVEQKAMRWYKFWIE
jgi:hypothetical protein